jgi:leucyl aminopeptidase
LPSGATISSRICGAGSDIAEAVLYVAGNFQRLLGRDYVLHPIKPETPGDPSEYFNVIGHIAGSDPSAGVVILGAHIDSTNVTACSGFPHRPPLRDQTNAVAAPGADDDASGVAAVLLAARVLKTLAGETPPRREIRFAIFNGEEVLMLGSKQYAEALQGIGEQVVAMVTLDMIGWTGGAYANQSPIVVHGPGESSAWAEELRRLSCEIQEVVRKAGEYETKGFGVVCDPSHPVTPETSPFVAVCTMADGSGDPMAMRSDHGSFYTYGYPACLISEQGMHLVGGAQTIPPADPDYNPEYHSPCDREVNFELASGVARVAAAAIWMMAKQH